MPQISKIKHSDVLEARRYDAEFFKPEYLRLLKNISLYNSVDFGNIIEILTDGKHGGVTFINDGVLFLRNTNIVNGTVNLSDKLFISEDESNESKRAEITTGDILLTTIGTIGECAVVPDEVKKANINQNLVKIRLKIGNSPIFISNFLNSKYGKFQTQRMSSGNVQPLLNYPKIRQLKIPTFPQSFQLQIEGIIKLAHQKQTQSKQLYHEAEQLLLQELGLLDYTPKHSLTFSTTKKEIAEATRYDSEYFQPKYYDIIEKIENYKGGFDTVKNILKFNKKNFFPKEDEYYNYIPLSKVSNNGTIDIPEKELGINLPTRARRKVKEGEFILSSISGSLETSAMIEKEHEGFVVSNGFYVFSSDQINTETLLILFKSRIMLEILDRISKGAILGGYDLTAFEKVKLPLIKTEIQSQIAQKIQESHRLRKESKDLLEEAKRRVEEEIERG